MKMNSITGKLLLHACCAAIAAFVFGFFLIRTTIKHFDSLYFTIVVSSGVSLILVLFWARSAIRRFSTNETAKKSAGQFLWSCIFFSMLSFSFGFAVSGLIWYSTDFLRTFTAIWFGALTCVGIYPIVRDTKRLADAAGLSQITSVR
jgi:cytochrome b561